MDYSNECSLVRDRAVVAAREEIRMFCRIMGYPKNEHNDFIGDDPHGVVAIQEDYMFFNMSDIHVVLKEYERWLKIYGDNKGIRKAVEQWYYYCIDWHEKHRPIEWHDPSKVMPPEDKERFKGHKRYISVPVLGRYKDGDQYVMCYQIWRGKSGWVLDCGLVDHLIEPDAWSFLPNDDGTYCPNLRSWLAGCPVEGLRDATLEWQTQRENDLQAAHQRVEECKQALEDAIKEEVKLNN